MKNDHRYCYGANCTWNGPIQEVSNTKTHPFHKQMQPLTVKIGSREIKSEDFSLPCCPLCGGMLLEMESKDEWESGVDAYDKSHPGYKAMYLWQRDINRCFPTIGELVDAFSIATGTVVKLGNQQILR